MSTGKKDPPVPESIFILLDGVIVVILKVLYSTCSSVKYISF